jgi:hypothetical protein
MAGRVDGDGEDNTPLLAAADRIDRISVVIEL